jgi:hypothetical protein
MANLSVLNRTNSVNRDLRFYAQFLGSVLTLYPSRYTHGSRQRFSFLSDVISQFPRNSFGQFNDSLTEIDFASGLISGGDQQSPAFSPVLPSSGNAVVVVVAVSITDVLSVSYGSVKSIALAEADMANNAFPATTQIPLYALLLSNSGSGVVISSMADLKPDFVSGPFDSEHVLFKNSTNVQTNFQLLEYLASDASLNSNSLSIWNTRLKANDAITVLSTAGSTSANVVSVAPGYNAPDTVTVDTSLPMAFTVANLSRVTLATYTNLRQVSASRSEILYDSGWNAISTSADVDLTHNLSRNIYTYSVLVYCNLTKSMQGARLLHQWSDNGLTQTYGVQVRLNLNAFHLHFGSSYLYPILDSSGNISSTVTSGFYRAIVVAN